MGPVEDCAGGRLSVDIVAGAHVRIGGVRWDERLRLGGDRREHTVLIEARAVCASSIWGVLEARAANLDESRQYQSRGACPRLRIDFRGGFGQ